MKFHQVQYFLAVWEERSFTRAARRCGVAQPTVTKAIKDLEDRLGGALLVRQELCSNYDVELGNSFGYHSVRARRPLSSVKFGIFSATSLR